MAVYRRDVSLVAGVGRGQTSSIAALTEGHRHRLLSTTATSAIRSGSGSGLTNRTIT